MAVWAGGSHVACNPGTGCWPWHTTLAGFRSVSLPAFRVDETGGSHDGCLVLAFQGAATRLEIYRRVIRDIAGADFADLSAT